MVNIMLNLPGTKCIPLSKGYHAIVDEDDYENLSKYKWYAVIDGRNVYATRTITNSEGKRVSLRMHRVINNTPAGLLTDHINGNGLDNRKCNLRTTTPGQNGSNRRKRRGASSKYLGVSWNKGVNKWVASLGKAGRSHHLGVFISEEEARDAYVKAALVYHGEFSSTIYS